MRRIFVKARNRLLGITMLQRSIDDLAKRVDPTKPGARYCTICGYTGGLGPGPNGRPDACCPKCGSLERHRLIWLYLSLQTDLLTRPQRMLHFAPERAFQSRLKNVETLDYVTGDIESPLADVKLDIQNLPFEDDSFDFILCSHVLEHIPDDRRAMGELHRVTKPGGCALVDVPLKRGPTYEDPTIVSPEERQKHFGQSDHVRYYGEDIRERLEAAGFRVHVERYYDRFDPHLREHFKVNDEVLFICSK